MHPHPNETIRNSLKRLAAKAALVIVASVISIFATSLAVGGAASAAGIDTNDPTLPPCKGPVLPFVCGYFAQTPVTYILPGPVTITIFDILHYGFLNVIRTPVTPVGANEFETFNSTLTGNVSINGGPRSPVTLTGPVQTEVFGKVGNITGTFATEMLNLDLTGVVPGLGTIAVHESPTLQSTGQTMITAIGGGLFHIESFFDVFTELSINGETV